MADRQVRRERDVDEGLVASVMLGEQGVDLRSPLRDLGFFCGLRVLPVCRRLGAAVGGCVEERRSTARGDRIEDESGRRVDSFATRTQPIRGPRRTNGLLGQRVRRTVFRWRGELVDAEALGIDGRVGDGVGDDGDELVEEFRPAARFVAGLAPVMRRDEQIVARSRQRDVEESTILLQPALVDRLLVQSQRLGEFFAVADARGCEVEGRETLPRPRFREVATQRSRQLLGAAHPRRIGPPTGEDPCRDVRQRDDIPLEPLGRMHREDLDALLGHLDPAGLESLLDGLGGVEKGQQAGQIRAGTVGVRGDVLGKGVEMFAAGDRATHATGPDLSLDADTDRVLDVGDELGQRLADAPAQRLELRAERPDTGVSLRCVRLRIARIDDGVGDSGTVDDLGRQHGVERGVEFFAAGDSTTGCREGVGGEVGGTPPQCGDVGGAQLPARAGQESHRCGPGHRIRHQPQRRDDVLDLRYVEQPADTDHLGRDSPTLEFVRQRRRILVAAHQDRDGRRVDAVALGITVVTFDGLPQPCPLVDHRRGEGHRDRSRRRVGSRAQHADRNSPAPQLFRGPVRELERVRGVAPTREQLEPLRRPAVGAREIGGEAGKVGRRRAAPAVDGLDRIADRRDSDRRNTFASRRFRTRTTEQRRQQDSLRMACVLVLVEQHGTEGPPLTRRNVRIALHQLGGQRHLTAEVECGLFTHRVAQRRHHRQQFTAFVDDLLDLDEVFARRRTLPRAGRQCVDHRPQVVAPRGQRVEIDEMFGHLAVQPQHCLGHAGGHFGGVQRAGPVRHDRERELPQLGLAQQRRTRFDGQQQPVVGDEPARVRVIGAHLGVGRTQPRGQHAVGVPVHQGWRPREHRESTPNAGAQFAGRLAGERESEDLVG